MSAEEVAFSTPVCTTSFAFSVLKNPAPSTMYENTAATTTNAVSTIAASRPVNPRLSRLGEFQIFEKIVIVHK